MVRSASGTPRRALCGPRRRQGCSSAGMQASDAGADWFARRVSPARIHRSSGQTATPSPRRSAPTLPLALRQAPTGRVRRIECAASQRGRQWRNAPHRAPTSGSARRARGLQRVPRMGAAVAERCTRHHGGEVRPRSRVSHAPCRPQPPFRATGGVHPQRHHGRPVVAPGSVFLAGVVMGAMDGIRLPGVRCFRAPPRSAPSWQDHPVRRRRGEHVGRLPRGVGREVVGWRPAAPRGGNGRWISRPSSPLRGVPRLDVAEGQKGQARPGARPQQGGVVNAVATSQNRRDHRQRLRASRSGRARAQLLRGDLRWAR